MNGFYCVVWCVLPEFEYSSKGALNADKDTFLYHQPAKDTNWAFNTILTKEALQLKDANTRVRITINDACVVRIGLLDHKPTKEGLEGSLKVTHWHLFIY